MRKLKTQIRCVDQVHRNADISPVLSREFVDRTSELEVAGDWQTLVTRYRQVRPRCAFVFMPCWRRSGRYNYPHAKKHAKPKILRTPHMGDRPQVFYGVQWRFASRSACTHRCTESDVLSVSRESSPPSTMECLSPDMMIEALHSGVHVRCEWGSAGVVQTPCPALESGHIGGASTDHLTRPFGSESVLCASDCHSVQECGGLGSTCSTLRQTAL